MERVEHMGIYADAGPVCVGELLRQKSSGTDSRRYWNRLLPAGTDVSIVMLISICVGSSRRFQEVMAVLLPFFLMLTQAECAVCILG